MSITVLSNDPKADAVVNKATEALASEPIVETPSAPEASASEHKEETANSEAAATETEEETEDQEVQETGETETEEEKEEKNRSKKKGGFQRRIDKLNTRVTAAQQEAEYWKQQALKSAGATETKPTVEAAKPAAGDGKPKPEAFDTHAEYTEALTDWKTDQKLNERDRKMEQSKLQIEQAKVANSYVERAKAFAEKTKDYQDVLDEVDHVPLSPAVREMLLTSENGPELAYELAKDPKEFARVCKLPALSAAIEIGVLKAKLKASVGTQEPKRVSSAPKPIAGVGGGGRATAPPKTLEEAANSSYAEYKKLREEQLKPRRRA